MHPIKNVTISGSYRKFNEELKLTIEQFKDLRVNVLSPKSGIITSSAQDFVFTEGDLVSNILCMSSGQIDLGMRLIEEEHLRAIKHSDALWLVIPNGYIGFSTAVEVGYALAHRIPIFYDKRYSHYVREPILRVCATPVNGIGDLVSNYGCVPRVDQLIHKIARSMFIPQYNSPNNGLSVAVGPFVVDFSERRRRKGQPRDSLFVRTHKWKGKFSIVGGKMNQVEDPNKTFERVLREQTRLSGVVREEICTFAEVPDGGYHRREPRRLFLDRVIEVDNRAVQLDERAQEFVWMPPEIALRELDLEPSASYTTRMYIQNNKRVA